MQSVGSLHILSVAASDFPLCAGFLPYTEDLSIPGGGTELVKYGGSHVVEIQQCLHIHEYNGDLKLP